VAKALEKFQAQDQDANVDELYKKIIRTGMDLPLFPSMSSTKYNSLKSIGNRNDSAGGYGDSEGKCRHSTGGYHSSQSRSEGRHAYAQGRGVGERHGEKLNSNGNSNGGGNGYKDARYAGLNSNTNSQSHNQHHQHQGFGQQQQHPRYSYSSSDHDRYQSQHSDYYHQQLDEQFQDKIEGRKRRFS
jgi:hypothetical protein